MSSSIIFVQSGGPTAVINATLAAALGAAAAQGFTGSMLGARFGFEGLASGDWVDLSAKAQDKAWLERLAQTPGSILGSTRRPADIDAIAASVPNDCRLILIGGNGTTATAQRIDKATDCQVIAVPKTVDNDLATAAIAPGYLSAAQFIAQVTRDIGCDHRAMQRFDQVSIIETMGRDSGWLALAASAFRQSDREPPHITLIPEVTFDEAAVFSRLTEVHADQGYAVMIVNEALRTEGGALYGAEAIDGPRDGMGRLIYSLSTGTSAYLAKRVREELGLQARAIRPGTYGRAASTTRSATDVTLAHRVGVAAIEALSAKHSVAITVEANLNVSCIALELAPNAPNPVALADYDQGKLAPTSAFLGELYRQLDPPKPILVSV